MDKIELKAPAKINLALDVLSKRDDGYHELKMIMQTVELADLVTIELTAAPGRIKLSSGLRWLPNDNRNLAYAAAELILDRFQVNRGVSIHLKKRIPVAAGLAGGSTDCAAVLRGLNKLFSLNLSLSELMDLGEQLGADVPFCLFGGTALAEGKGERLTRLPALPDAFVALIKPPFSVSTADIFKSFNPDAVNSKPDVNKMIDKIKNNDLIGICNCFANSLETVTVGKYPAIEQIKKELINRGALGTLMSGSGPTVFGVFENRLDAQRAVDFIEKKFNHQLPQIMTMVTKFI